MEKETGIEVATASPHHEAVGRGKSHPRIDRLTVLPARSCSVFASLCMGKSATPVLAKVLRLRLLVKFAFVVLSSRLRSNFCTKVYLSLV